MIYDLKPELKQYYKIRDLVDYIDMYITNLMLTDYTRSEFVRGFIANLRSFKEELLTPNDGSLNPQVDAIASPEAIERLKLEIDTFSNSVAKGN